MKVMLVLLIDFLIVSVFEESLELLLIVLQEFE